MPAPTMASLPASIQDVLAIFSGLGAVTCLLMHKRTVRGDVALVSEVALFTTLLLTKAAGGATVGSAALYATTAVIVHCLTLALLTIAYRISPFHPLAAFPGPLLNKITGLHLAYIVLKGKRHLVIKDYHSKYGKFVRTGPSTLSINSSSAVGPIYTNATCYNKSDGYRLGHVQGAGLFFMRDREEHNKRKSVWAGAFTPSALESYRPALEKRTRELCGCIEERTEPTGTVNLTECFQHWSYDFMGELVFGGASRLELMTDGDPQGFVECGQVATKAFEILGEVPWLFDILWHLPVTQDIHALENFAAKLMRERAADTNATHKDVCAHLLGEHEKHSFKLTEDELNVDSLFAIQAGSDTSSTVLTFIFVFLFSHPEVMKRLQAELESTFPSTASKDTYNYATLATLPYLNAVIDESLRLGTPFPGLPRVVPDGGAVFDGQFVPAGTIVGVPAYTQQVLEDNFYPEPYAFKPERWLPGGLGPDARCKRSALMCFSFGPFGCLGRNLAIQELRIVVARLMMTFELAPAPEFSFDKFWEGTTNMRTTFFAHPLTVTAVRKHKRA